jgi:hypothetical protein
MNVAKPRNDGVLVAYFVDAKTDAEWEHMARQHAAEHAPKRHEKEDEACLRQRYQLQSYGPSISMNDVLLRHRSYDPPEVDTYWERDPALIQARHHNAWFEEERR